MENKSDKRLMILEASERSEEVSKIAVERTSQRRCCRAPTRKFQPRQPVADFQPAISSGSWSRPMGVNRAKWERYCAEKGFTGRIFRPGDGNAQKELCRR